MKRTLLILTAFLFVSTLFAQETDLQEEVQNEFTESPAQDVFPDSQSPAPLPFDFVLQFEPAIYINTESTLVSAPSPIVYPISFGIIWPNYSKIAVQPTLSFFMMQHLLYDGKAVPAEIENRTTTTLSFMLNIPVVFSFFMSNSRFQVWTGPAVFMRFGLLSPGVKETDSGWLGSAGEDVSAINSWFWNDLRWFYFTAGGTWLYNLTSNLRAGPVMQISIPVGGLISDHTAQGMLISAGIKICR